jgi:hypothetical protein
MVLLLLLLLTGVLGDAFRSNFPERSVAFIVASAALIPVAVASLALLVRLVAAYRRSRSQGGDAGRSRAGLRDRNG